MVRGEEAPGKGSTRGSTGTQGYREGFDAGIQM